MHGSKALRASGGLVAMLVAMLAAATLLAGCVPVASDPLKGTAQPGQAINDAKGNASQKVDDINAKTQESLDVQQQTTGEGTAP